MSVVWRKVWRDLAHNRLRTLLVVLSTAVGVLALGLVFGLSGVMRVRLTEDHRGTIPAHLTYWSGPFNQTAVDAVLEEPGVADAECQTWTSVRWRMEGETEWHDGNLAARVDYDAQRMELIDLLEGNWPGERTLALERQSSRYFGIPIGTSVIVEFGHGERRLPVDGIVRASTVYPPQMGGNATFYATLDTVTWLVGDRDYNQLSVRLESFSQEVAEEAGKRVKARLERVGLSVGGPWITDPDEHWLQDLLDTLFTILTVLGALSLGLSVFLVVNTMNAIVAQQIWQIGLMKVVGATLGRVMRVYLMTVLIYGLLASVIAVPLGAIGAHLMAGWILDLINVDVGPFRVMPLAVAVQVAVGLTVPLLAASVPVFGGARVSPHRAISSYGLGAGFGRGRFDQLIGRIRRLPRLLALSLRNTFRRKGRVVLTLITLVLGGVMFIMVMSVRSSLENTLEMVISDLGLDLWVVFDRSYRTERLVEVAESAPGVATAEVWDQRQALLSLADGEEREMYLWGLPPDSALFHPRIVSGRSLLPGDDHAILLNNKIATDEGFQVGDEIELTIGGRVSDWTIVGLVLNLNNLQRDSFVPHDALARETGTFNRGALVMVLSERHDAASQETLIQELRAVYTAHGLEPADFLTAAEVREQNRAQFDVLTYLMLSMAILAALVGSLGLMGTMSINAVERSREIGVMRAVGATSAIVTRVFVVEGVLLGILSWLLAAPLSYPGARLFSRLVSSLLIPLGFRYSVVGVVTWLGIVIVLSALASLWPALRASKVSVREALAYE